MHRLELCLFFFCPCFSKKSNPSNPSKNYRITNQVMAKGVIMLSCSLEIGHLQFPWFCVFRWSGFLPNYYSVYSAAIILLPIVWQGNNKETRYCLESDRVQRFRLKWVPAKLFSNVVLCATKESVARILAINWISFQVIGMNWS